MAVDWNDEESVNAHYLETSRIVCAANRVHGPDGEEYLLIGARHWDKQMHKQMDNLKKMWIAQGYEVDKDTGMLYNHNIGVDQGFIDQYQRFISREAAWVIAEKQGQIIREVSSPGMLFSENLY